MKKLILGNIITLDKSNSVAEAIIVENGLITFVGSKDEAKKLCNNDTIILDYGTNSVYPGFLESHSHGFFAGMRAVGQAKLSDVYPTNYDKYREIIKKFIEDNPDKEFYVAAGWEENEENIDKSYLDEICSDKPLVMNTGGGHSCLLNSKALEVLEVNADYAKKMGYDLVHVDKNGDPDGYICEMPAIELMGSIPNTVQDAKTYLLNWQDTMLSKGFTAVADAGAELMFKDASKAYCELENEGKLRMRTYSYLMVPDNPSDTKAEVERIAADRSLYSGEYYNIIGVKGFLDGVTEAHTAWLKDDYNDESGYHGVERFNASGRMIDLLVAANDKDLSVHVHSEGDGATEFMLDCIEKAEEITGNKNQRNVLAHLHFVQPKDLKRMAETGSVPAVAPLWTAKISGEYDNEVVYVGKERADSSYPIKSFYDKGANVVFHSDYPISPIVSVPRSIYMAEVRAIPEEEGGGLKTQRNISESISREQSLRAMTTNVAYAWKQEKRMGSIEKGKLANFAVFDVDFLHDDINKIPDAKVVATIADGEIVYKV